MTNLEKELQDLLNALENGQDLESVFQGSPDEAQELFPLLGLVDQIKGLPHPEPSAAQTAKQQQKIMGAARDIFTHHRTTWLRSLRNARFAGKDWIFARGMVGALVLSLLFIVLVTAGSYLAITQHIWTTAQVMAASGTLQSSPDEQPYRWHTIQPGERISEGERIRTAMDATAQLRFPDGSQIALAPQSEISLVEIKRSWNGQVEIELSQYSGETQNDVIPFTDGDSRYQVNTSSGIVNVRGTSFGVIVDPASGTALFSVSKGSIWVASGSETVLVEVGQATKTKPDMTPNTPAYGFQIKGILDAWEADALIINAMRLLLSEDLLIQGKPEVGEMVRVAGHIDSMGIWWVDSITSSGGQIHGSFSGILESKGDTYWVISGTPVMVYAQTKLSSSMSAGDAVKVDFIVLDDGSILATNIRLLDEEVEQVDPEAVAPSPTPDEPQPQTDTESLSPGEVDCVGAEVQPTGLTLAQRYAVQYEEIMGWFCQGYGFGEIDLAYSLSLESGVPVSEIFAMREDGAGWGAIKDELSEKIKATKEPKIKEDKDKEDKEEKDK